MANFEEEAAKLNVKNIIVTMILSAFGFLVALQWRDVIKDTIDTIMPVGEGLYYKYLAAIIVTIIAVIVTYILVKIQKIDIIPDKYENRFREKVRKQKQKIKYKVKKAPVV